MEEIVLINQSLHLTAQKRKLLIFIEKQNRCPYLLHEMNLSDLLKEFVYIHNTGDGDNGDTGTRGHDTVRYTNLRVEIYTNYTPIMSCQHVTTLNLHSLNDCKVTEVLGVHRNDAILITGYRPLCIDHFKEKPPTTVQTLDT